MHIPKSCPVCHKDLSPFTALTALARWGGFLAKMILALQGKPVRMNNNNLVGLVHKCAVCGQPRF